MTAHLESHPGHDTPPPPARTKGEIVVSWITTTDHKVIGSLYLITSFMFFIAAGIMALLMRTELARPGLQFLRRRDEDTACGVSWPNSTFSSSPLSA